MDKNNFLAFKGNRFVWRQFINIVKKNKTNVWNELEPMLNDFIQKNNKKKVNNPVNNKSELLRKDTI